MIPKRYDLEYIQEDSDRLEMCENPDGEWIKWADYYELRQAAIRPLNTGGYGATVTGGHRSTVTGGYRSTVTGGYGGSIACRWYDYKKDRYRLLAADVGEDGIEPGVAYCVKDGRFVRRED